MYNESPGRVLSLHFLCWLPLPIFVTAKQHGRDSTYEVLANIFVVAAVLLGANVE